MEFKDFDLNLFSVKSNLESGQVGLNPVPVSDNSVCSVHIISSETDQGHILCGDEGHF